MGIYRTWWVGLIALIVQTALNQVWFNAITIRLPDEWILPAAKIGPPLRAVLVLIAGLLFF